MFYNDGNFVLIQLFAESGDGLASKDKKILLEQYGYDIDADDCFSQSSPKVFVFFYDCKFLYNFFELCLICFCAQLFNLNHAFKLRPPMQLWVL